MRALVDGNNGNILDIIADDGISKYADFFPSITKIEWIKWLNEPSDFNS